MNPDLVPRTLWDEYDSLQKRVEQITTIGHITWAVEDQLNTFLDSIANNCLAADVSTRQKQLNNLKVNRQKKHLHRLRLLESFSATQAVAEKANAFDRVLQAEQVARVRSLTNAVEFGLLWRLARDETYEDLAAENGVTVGTLKTRMSRCRCRLRQRLAA
jgi:DNA-directed RNA polymerase specialized sigma24 family protein